MYPLLPVMICAGCAGLPETFPPPEQRKALTVPPATGLGYYVSMSDPNAGAYIVQGIAGRTDDVPWRWAYEHPVLQFQVPDVGRLRFILDFSLPERTFRQTGPVTLTFSINGRWFDRARFDTPGELHYSH